MFEPVPAPAGLTEALRPRISELPASKIREVADAGIGRADLIPLWFGEPDLPTPAFICEAASRALRAGDTFY
jgi:aspartate/methionine/tyrosine aminotransferase